MEYGHEACDMSAVLMCLAIAIILSPRHLHLQNSINHSFSSEVHTEVEAKTFKDFSDFQGPSPKCLQGTKLLAKKCENISTSLTATSMKRQRDVPPIV